MLKITTSGSTGEPFTTFVDRHQLEIRWATTLRSMEWTGYKFGDKQIRLWHQTLGMSFTQIIREKIDAILSRRKFIPAYQMTKSSIDRSLKKIADYKPKFLDGYAESFNLLSHYIKDKAIENIKVDAILSSAQVLPKETREIIENSFGAKVFDKYGSREFSGIAYECERNQGLHIASESYIVEILSNGKPVKPGELGEVVITDLNNRCVPLIRYRIGDLARSIDSSISCECGRGLIRIKSIEGRVQAIIKTADGTFLPGTFFAHFFKDYEKIIKQYQVVQNIPGEFTLKIIKGPSFNSEDHMSMLNNLKTYVGDDTKIEIEFVNKIPLGRTGKRQGSVSHYNIDFQAIDNDTKAKNLL